MERYGPFEFDLAIWICLNGEICTGPERSNTLTRLLIDRDKTQHHRWPNAPNPVRYALANMVHRDHSSSSTSAVCAQVSDQRHVNET